jgi:hypothetical protein
MAVQIRVNRIIGWLWPVSSSVGVGWAITVGPSPRRRLPQLDIFRMAAYIDEGRHT